MTLKKEVFQETDFADPGVVKVVTDPNGIALYFSRSLIPYPRNRTAHFRVFEHVGVYAYTRECLLSLAALRSPARRDRKPGTIARAGEWHSDPGRGDRAAGAEHLRRHAGGP